VFSYMLRDITLDQCHNYMSKFQDNFFWSLHKHFANLIGKFKMTSKYTWSWRPWSKRRLRGWRYIMNGFRS
jgi:hypothetical protein